MAQPPQDSQRSGNVTAFPGVDLAALLRTQGIDPETIVDPFARSRPVLLDTLVDTQNYRVRVELDGVRPTVWRRLELAGNLKLGELHDVLQIAMGWTDSHLHAFHMGPGPRDHRRGPFLTAFDIAEGDDGVPEDEVRLEQVVRQVGDRLYYDYDFGDGWEHVVTVEAVSPRHDSDPRATCTGGERACPPEDVGGPPGYEEMLDVLARGTTDAWLLEKLAWMPDGFDPAAFDADQVDEQVRMVTAGVAVEGLSDGLTDLLERLDPRSFAQIAPWIDVATHTDLSYDEPVASALVAPWTALLEHVGDGLDLTSAGYLKPASVSHLVTVLRDLGRLGRHADIAFGKANREEHVQPVGWLRTSAVAVGLVRKSKGRLLPTAAGLECRDHSHLLLERLAAKLPLGRKDHERDAGTLVLLATGADRSIEGSELATILASAGWLVGRAPARDWEAADWARPTWDVLRLAGWNPGRPDVLAHDERAYLLGLLAIRPPRT